MSWSIRATRSRFQRVSDLVEGFESPFGLELLATVHWVAKKEGAQTLQEVTQKTFEWNERKKQFSPRQIDVAARTLAKHEWIEVSL